MTISSQRGKPNSQKLNDQYLPLVRLLKGIVLISWKKEPIFDRHLDIFICMDGLYCSVRHERAQEVRSKCAELVRMRPHRTPRSYGAQNHLQPR